LPACGRGLPPPHRDLPLGQESDGFMPPFPKPRFAYEYDLAQELAALRVYPKQKPDRKIPRKSADTLLLATWNIANLGVQDRLDSDYALIAEMVGWFDLAAIQEVNDDLRG